MKELKFIPIYKGEYNMTPEEYIEEVENTIHNRRLVRDIITSVEWSVMAICMLYIMTAIIR